MSKLKEFVTIVDAIGKQLAIPHAIGGGVAVRAHGYRRETTDVDAFFLPEDRNRVLRAFRETGLHVERVMVPFHYAALPEDATNIEERIDILFPEGDPEVSAIEMFEKLKVEGVPGVQVFPAELLVIGKLLYSDRWQDFADVAELYQIGAFDPDEAERLTKLMDPEASFKGELAELLKPRAPKRSRKKR